MSISALSSRFFAAVVVILLVCRLVSWAVGRVGQPPVVGEMIAGVLLGASLLGAVASGAENELFPAALRPLLYAAGQNGRADAAVAGPAGARGRRDAGPARGCGGPRLGLAWCLGGGPSASREAFQVGVWQGATASPGEDEP